MILSFGWTAHLLPPNGCKDTTRRGWAESYLKAWQSQYDRFPEKWHKAYDKSSFVKGAKQIGWVQLKERPFLEALRMMTPDEVTREGHPEWVGQDFDSVQKFVDHYFFKPKASWDMSERIIAWGQLMATEFAVVRFTFNPNPHENPND